MFCKKCGNPLSEDDVFCPNCGNKTDLPRDGEKADNANEAQPFKGLIFEDKEPSYSNANIQQSPTIPEQSDDSDESETEFAQETTELAAADQNENPSPFNALTHPLFIDNDALPDSEAKPEKEIPMATPEFIPEDATQMSSAEFQAEDFTMMADRNQSRPVIDDETVAEKTNQGFEQNTDLMDDSYNVYSGAVPGLTSQDFRYPTNDNAYPQMQTTIGQSYDDEATQGFDYTRQADVQPQQYQYSQQYPQPNYQQYPQQYRYPQEEYPAQPNQSYMEPQQPKNKNTAMWVIIICISIAVIAIGATCAVILTQYDSFGDFFASFSDEKKDKKDDDSDKDDKKEEETTLEITTSEPTTVELTTMPTTTAPRAYDGFCGLQVMYDYDEASKQLVIFGNGEMNNYANILTPWSDYDVSAVIIEDGVTSVTPGAFTEIMPKTISVSATVSSFDVLALHKFGSINVSPSNAYYMSMNGVLFDKSQTRLIAYPNLNVNTSYAVPEGVRWIGEYAFYEATNLNYLVVSSSVELIGDYAFKNCYNIYSFELPATVTEIRSGIFYGWNSNQNITIMNPETRAVEDWNEGCGANVVLG